MIDINVVLPPEFSAPLAHPTVRLSGKAPMAEIDGYDPGFSRD
jgi:hypothetical protein